MPNLLDLPARDRSGAVRVIVETPRGSRMKLKFNPELSVFELTRPLVLGVAYPYDWGFVPGTIAPDGDPLDAMILHEAPTYPGVLVACRLIGAVLVTQKSEDGQRQRNDRVIAAPVEDLRVDDGRNLPARVKKELEQFFVVATLETGKQVHLEGWQGPQEAEALLSKAQQAHRRRARPRAARAR